MRRRSQTGQSECYQASQPRPRELIFMFFPTHFLGSVLHRWKALDASFLSLWTLHAFFWFPFKVKRGEAEIALMDVTNDYAQASRREITSSPLSPHISPHFTPPPISSLSPLSSLPLLIVQLNNLCIVIFLHYFDPWFMPSISWWCLVLLGLPSLLGLQVLPGSRTSLASLIFEASNWRRHIKAD